jgi:3-methyl-2-oxobutanoate hydroxymethyltransferase
MPHSYLTSGLPKSLTHLDLLAMKQRGEKITCLTAYDASFSALIDAAKIEVILVGDSLGMVIQGNPTTLPVKIDDMIYHTRCVTKTCKRALVIADLPFMTYATPESAAQNAAALIQTGGAQMVKLEGAKIDVIQFLVAQGISVCGHLGLLPQFIHQLGGYKVQGKVAETAAQLLADALAIQNAGALMLVLECVPADLARQITEQLTIPVIGNFRFCKIASINRGTNAVAVWRLLSCRCFAKSKRHRPSKYSTIYATRLGGNCV